MRAIEIFRLRRVRDKPETLAILQRCASFDVPAARAVINQAVGGGRPRLLLPDDRTARVCIAAMAAAGFVARFAQVDGFDARCRAERALQDLAQSLPSAMLDAVGALLIADDWLGAFLHALEHVRAHAAPTDPQRVLLEDVALEIGLVAGASGRT